MKYSTFNISRARGFTLVELMIALTIGLIILAAVSTLFVNSKKTYTTQDNLSRLQENARFAMQFLIKDLRLAGYYGCVADVLDNTVFNKVTSGTAFENDALTPLEGMDGASGRWYPSTTSTSTPTGIKSGTDAITIRMADASSNARVTTTMTTEGGAITVNSTSGLKNNDVVVISDCSVANVVPVTVTTTTSLTPATSLSKLFGPSASSPYSTNGTRVMKFFTRRYFIATGASGNPTLFRQDSSAGVAGNPVEVVDGIENIQILYGVNTDNLAPKIPNTYLAAGATGLTTPAQWASVVSVRIGILVRTVNDKDTDIDTGSYDIDGTGSNNFTAPGDRYKRRVFQTAVFLRNAQ